MVGATTLRSSAHRLEERAAEAETEEDELRARTIAFEADRVAALANQR